MTTTHLPVMALRDEVHENVDRIEAMHPFRASDDEMHELLSSMWRYINVLEVEVGITNVLDQFDD